MHTQTVNRFSRDVRSYSDPFAIVVASYHAQITDKLLHGAVRTLKEAGVADNKIEVFSVPGAWEIPLAVKALAEQSRYAAIITLGAVIRGETSHDQHINRYVSLSIGAMAEFYRLPIPFGVLTCNSLAQAEARAGGAVGNKGSECAEAALAMIDLLDQIQNRSSAKPMQ